MNEDTARCSRIQSSSVQWCSAASTAGWHSEKVPPELQSTYFSLVSFLALHYSHSSKMALNCNIQVHLLHQLIRPLHSTQQETRNGFTSQTWIFLGLAIFMPGCWWCIAMRAEREGSQECHELITMNQLIEAALSTTFSCFHLIVVAMHLTKLHHTTPPQTTQLFS